MKKYVMAIVGSYLSLNALPSLAAASQVVETYVSAALSKSNAADKRLSRYLIHDDGTVTDTHTRLMWKRCAEGRSGTDCSQVKVLAYTWDDAMSKFGQSVNFAGYSDWRLPTIAELRTLVYCSNGFSNKGNVPRGAGWKGHWHDCSGGNANKIKSYQRPTIDQQVFPNTTAHWFWSSSVEINENDAPAYISFDYGDLNWNFNLGMRTVGQVRLVRIRQ